MRVVEEEDRTILYSSHNTQDVEQISDTITFIDRGQVIASQNRDEYLQQWRRIRLRVSVKTGRHRLLRGWPSIQSFAICACFTRSIFRWRAGATTEHGAEIESIEPMTLEEIFVSSVMRAERKRFNVYAGHSHTVLEDLFLSRKPLFAYLAGGLVCACLTCTPIETVSFVGFIMVITVAIASGIHLIGTLLLAESMEQTRLFVMSLPVSLLDYSLAKLAVVLTTYLIPGVPMLMLFIILSFVVPGAKAGSVAVVRPFLALCGGFTVQLVTAVVTESLGWTIAMVVAGNVGLNVFLKNLFENPLVSAAAKSDTFTVPAVIRRS